MIPTTGRPGPAAFDMETSRRGNYDSGEDFVLEYGELRFTFNEDGLLRALRAGGAEARLRRRPPRRGGARRPRQPRCQRRDPRPRLSAGRARQRLLARADRPGRALPRPLAAAARLPRCLARPAGQRGRARRHLRQRDRQLRLRAAAERRRRRSSERRADRTRSRALLGPGRLPRQLARRRLDRVGAGLADRLGAVRPRRAARDSACRCPGGRGSVAGRSVLRARVECDQVVSPPSGGWRWRSRSASRRREGCARQRAPCAPREDGGPSRLSISTSASAPRAASRLAESIARSTAWLWESAEAAKLSAAVGARCPPATPRSPPAAPPRARGSPRARRVRRPLPRRLRRVSLLPARGAPTITTREPRPIGVSHSIASSVRSEEPSASRSLRPGDRKIVIARARRRPSPPRPR